MLLAHGHPNAADYTPGVIADETRFVVKRLDRMMASEAILTQSAIAASFSKSSADQFNKTVNKLLEV